MTAMLSQATIVITGPLRQQISPARRVSGLKHQWLQWRHCLLRPISYYGEMSGFIANIGSGNPGWRIWER